MLNRQRSEEKKCEKQPCNTKVREGGENSDAGAGGGMPLQPAERSCSKQISTLQPVEGPTQQQGKSVRTKEPQRGAVMG